MSCITQTCEDLPLPARPLAHQGLIDFAGWDFIANGPTKLDGEWAIYPGRFIAPSKAWKIWNNSAESRLFYRVPQIWNPIFGQSAPGLGATGYATYILQVKGAFPKPDIPHAIQLKSARSAYKMFIVPKNQIINNATPLMSNGRPSSTPDNEIPQNLLQTKTVELTNEDFLIVVHVSNHVIMLGGLRNPIWLGTESDLRSAERMHERMAFLVVGVLALLSIYHMILYGGRKENQGQLLFAGICALILIWYLLFDRLAHKSIAEPTALSFKAMDMVITVIYALCVPLFYHFLRLLFPKHFPKKIAFVIWSVTIINLFIRAIDYSGTYIVFVSYNVFMSIITILGILFLFRAYRKKRPGAGQSLAGFGLFAVTVLNDVAKTHNLLQTPTLAPIGLIGFSIIHSFILSRRRGYAGNPKLSGGNYRRSYLTGTDTSLLLSRLNDLMNTAKLHRLKDLTVQSLARELEISPHQLSELLNSNLGTTFKGYVCKLRVDEAKQHLAGAESGLSMESIAFSTGFRSISNFHRLFKKETGLTPKQYQRKIQQNRK